MTFLLRRDGESWDARMTVVPESVKIYKDYDEMHN